MSMPWRSPFIVAYSNRTAPLALYQSLRKALTVMPSADSAMPPGFSKAPWSQEKRPPSLARMKRTSPLALNPFQDYLAADGRLVGR